MSTLKLLQLRRPRTGWALLWRTVEWRESKWRWNNVFCFLFITLFMCFFPPHPLPSVKDHFFIRNFSMPSLGSRSIFLHPSNPLPPSARISHLWENPEALHSLLLVSWVRVSPGNGAEGCCAPGDRASLQLCSLIPKHFSPSLPGFPLPGWPSSGHRVTRRFHSPLRPLTSLFQGFH